MQNNIENIRHSLSHIMAQAVLEFWSKTKLGMGPAIENGFYYDFELRRGPSSTDSLSDSDLQKIESRMRELILQNQTFTKKNITKLAAKKIFKGQPYKLELIKELPDKTVSIYTNSPIITDNKLRVTSYELQEFTDLCKGPHVKNTSEINPKAFKLAKIAGAYWKGSEKNKMLIRIYGLAFSTEKELQDYIKMQEEAEKRDHRILGKKLKIYTMADEVGAGLILWLPNGVAIKQELEKWAIETEKKWGYQHVSTPHITKAELYKISGHLPYYKDDLYAPFEIEGEAYYLKPMNCPHTHMIYKSEPRSYRELPLRLAEYGQVYRYERSGTLHGLMRVRGFCQNDAHIYVRPENAVEEFINVLNLHKYYYNALGVKEWWVVLGVRDPKNLRIKYHGDDKMWKKAEKMTKEALDKAGVKYKIEEGGAAHYGPKADIYIKSAIGKEYAIGTDQLDLYMPERFNLSYIDKDGKEKMPYIIHRAPLGSHERMVGFLLEHYAGAFPVWLSPVQIAVIPISKKHDQYANEIAKKLKEQNIRVELKNENETLGKKIREAEMQKIPYLLIVGDKEISAKTVSIRERGKGDLGQMPLDKFLEKIKKEIESKS